MLNTFLTGIRFRWGAILPTVLHEKTHTTRWGLHDRVNHWVYHEIKSDLCGGSPGSPVVKNPPSNAGAASSIPGWGTKISHGSGQLNSHTHRGNQDPTCCNETTQPKINIYFFFKKEKISEIDTIPPNRTFMVFLGHCVHESVLYFFHESVLKWKDGSGVCKQPSSKVLETGGWMETGVERNHRSRRSVLTVPLA